MVHNGRTLTMARFQDLLEPVFYRYDNGKIAQIWSLIDIDAIRAQLTARSGTG